MKNAGRGYGLQNYRLVHWEIMSGISNGKMEDCLFVISAAHWQSGISSIFVCGIEMMLTQSGKSSSV